MLFIIHEVTVTSLCLQ